MSPFGKRVTTRVLLTFDKDLGEMAWKHHLPAQCGVILFRCAMIA